MKCRAVDDCRREAIFAIVSEDEVVSTGDPSPLLTMDTVTTMLVLQPVCTDHIAEEVHEARSCMADDEFTILRIEQTEGVGALR